MAPGAADSLPDTADARRSAAQAEAAYADFMQQSMEIRLGYLYGGSFISDAHRDRIAALATQTADTLERLHHRQEQVRSAIEAFEGPSWDEMYGQTGLWRTIYTDCHKTRLLKCRVDLYAAIAADDTRRSRTAHGVLNSLRNVAEEHDPATRLLHAEALWLTGGQTEQTNAEQIVDTVLAGPNVAPALQCWAILLRLRLTGRISAADFNRVSQAVAGGPCDDDFELNLQTAFLELRLNRPERGTLLKKTAARWPQAQDVMGRAILGWLDSQHAAGKLDADTIERRTPIEIALALKAARRTGPAAHRRILEKICASERFATPLALFLYAEACRETEPATAIRAYLRAAMTHQQSPDADLEAGAPEMARRAAQLAYKLYYDDTRYLDSARLAMAYYHGIAGPDVDQQLEYLYSQVLNESHLADQWRPLCQAIASKGGPFSHDAQLDLIAAQLKQAADAAAVAQAAEALEQLIASLDETDDHRRRVKRQATALYCKMLLERSADGDAQKVLDLLGPLPANPEWTLHVLKATALDKTQRADEAVAVLADAFDTLTCDAAPAVYAILTNIVERIEQYQSTPADDARLADKCRRLAALCLDCADAPGRPQVELLYAEITLLAQAPHEPAPAKIEQILNDPAHEHHHADWLRCRARLLTAQGRHDEAFAAWAALRESLAKTTDPARPWQWWQAKYYELLSFRQSSPDNHAKVAHAVAVLQGAFSDIPPIWAQKLTALQANPRR
ncbi:MAG: hypothetical protein IH624_18725 [Phycisphaerae bacterium]|nr:hypothetical protein [Phycisphaerae bacterium]